MKLLYLLILLLSANLLWAQSSTWHKAIADPVTVSISIQEMPGISPSQQDYSDAILDQLPGWPQTMAVHPNFKPSRGLALADINNDDTLEVIASSASQITAFDYHGNMLWSRNVTNIAQYCPAVADVNNDGWLEIAQTTRGLTDGGRVYLMDHDGNDLSGWPVNLSNQNIAGAACLADVDGDSIMEIIVGSRDYPIGHLHILKLDGTSFSSDWPVDLDHVPAVTAAVGDVDNDGENEIVYCSYNSIYVLNLQGQAETGFPVTPPNSNFSYQSPLLVDLTGDDNLEIITCTHGNSPHITIYDYQGQQLSGWPYTFPGWSYCPPTAVDMDGNGDWNIFAGCQGGLVAAPVLFGFELSGQLLPNFPIVKVGGAEGFISVADVDGDDTLEVLVDDNVTDTEGNGYLHAFELDGSGEAAGFPLRPIGFTYLNGAEMGDINNDGLLDVATISYNDQYTYINAWSLGVTYYPEKVLFGTYHANLTRDGLIPHKVPTSIAANEMSGNKAESYALRIFPNPMNSTTLVQISTPNVGRAELTLFDITGRKIRTIYQGNLAGGEHRFQLQANDLSSGIYFINLKINGRYSKVAKLILMK